MRVRPGCVLQLAFSLMLTHACYGQSNHMFTEPDSTLLFASPDYYVALAAGKQKFVVQNPRDFIGQGSSPLPALAPAGDRIAWALALPEDAGNKRYRSVMGVYSLRDRSWKFYGDFCPNRVGSAAFSSDGTEVAFTSKSSAGGQECSSNPTLLQLLDLKTGQLRTIPYSGREVMHNARLNWSPDGKYLAAQLGAWVSPTQSIVVIDLESGAGRITAEGSNPSWSPKGDWVAYIAGHGKRCALVHPDGTGATVVLDLGHSHFVNLGILSYGDLRSFDYGVVWSPDENSLLLNERQNPDSGIDVMQLDLLNRKVIMKARKCPPVFGWAPFSD
jgi:Tol biopolymer transport system component